MLGVTQGDFIMQREEQMQKTYGELYELMNYVPYKYSYTRRKIRELMDILNRENWLIEEKDVKVKSFKRRV